MLIVYIVCLMFMMGVFVWVHLSDVRQSITQYLMYIIMILSTLGYLFLFGSSNVDEAVIATKISYLGGCYLPVLYFFLMCDICHIKRKKMVTVGCILVQTVLFGFVCTIGKNDLYYRNLGMETIDGINYLTKDYGPVHIFYLITMGAYLIMALGLGIYVSHSNRAVEARSVRLLIYFSVVAVICFMVEKLTGLRIEIMPVTYVIIIIGTIIPVYRSNLYTVYENKEIIDNHLNQVGFITFTPKMVYMGCNGYMGKLYPELVQQKVGKPLRTCSEELENNIIIHILDFDRERNRDEENCADKWMYSFKHEGKAYDCTITTIKGFTGMCMGYTVEIRDETEHYHALEMSEKYNDMLSEQVYEKIERIKDMQDQTILGMAQMVESRDLSTGGHIRRTSDVVKIFADKLLEDRIGYRKEFLELVIRSAPMHDLGKIGVDDAVLRKQGRFTDEEYEKMKKHSEIGAEIVRKVLTGVEEEKFIKVATNVAHYHHEKVNGTGYPKGLEGEEIPVEARIMALADVFDALVSKRCYKEAFSYDRAFEIIIESKGTHFDAMLVEEFIKCRSKLEEYYNTSAE